MHSGRIDSTEIASRPLLLERFEVLSVLGEGAAGSVYKVKDRCKSNQILALKLLVHDDAFDEHTRTRFKQEWQVSKALVHPNLVQAFEYIQLNDAVAFTMEFVDGRDLSKIVVGSGLSYSEIDDIFIQLLAAVAYMHSKGVYHRDIKLENILIGNDKVIKLSDLGLMKTHGGQKLTKTGILLGTAQYMPPEYVKGGSYDHRSDLYSLGVVLYELLGGHRWLSHMRGNEVIDFLFKNNFSFPKLTDQDIPRKYHHILKKALQPKPEKRYQTAEKMLAAFEQPECFYEYSHIQKESRLPKPILNESVEKTKSAWHIFSAVGIGLALATIGTTIYGSQFLGDDVNPHLGSYFGQIEDLKNNKLYPASIQIGSKGAMLLTKWPECQEGFISFTDKNLSCTNMKLRIYGTQNGQNLSLTFKSFFRKQATFKGRDKRLK